MRIAESASTTLGRLAAAVAALSIATCATTTHAQSTTNDASKNAIVKDTPGKASKQQFRPDIRARKAGPSKGVMGPPVPRAARKAAPRTKQNIPEPTVTLKPGEVPKIEFDTPTYNFGRIRAGADIIHDFWFTNNGTGPLEILAVKPG